MQTPLVPLLLPHYFLKKNSTLFFLVVLLFPPPSNFMSFFMASPSASLSVVGRVFGVTRISFSFFSLVVSQDESLGVSEEKKSINQMGIIPWYQAQCLSRVYDFLSGNSFVKFGNVEDDVEGTNFFFFYFFEEIKRKFDAEKYQSTVTTRNGNENKTQNHIAKIQQRISYHGRLSGG